MAILKEYLVIAELEGTGYIVGSFDTIPQAEQVYEELTERYNHIHQGKGHELFEKVMNYPTYKVHPTCIHQFENVYKHSTNGVYSTYIIITAWEGFSLKQLILDRSSTVYLYDIKDYDTASKRFVKSVLNLIAN
jgi:hypothetical protein